MTKTALVHSLPLSLGKQSQKSSFQRKRPHNGLIFSCLASCSVLMRQSRPPHSAVPVRGARPCWLPGGGSRLGHGPSGRSLLHPVSHHHGGEESLAAEGLSSSAPWKPCGRTRLWRLTLLSCPFAKIAHPEQVMIPESADDMPSLTSVLLSVMLKSPSVTR